MRYLFFHVLLIFCFIPFVTTGAALAADPAVETSLEHVDIRPAKAISLGEMEENGVIAEAWIYRVTSSDLPEKQISPLPYLLFVLFHAVDNNVRIEKGIAAFKLESSDEERTRARKLEFNSGYFVAGFDMKDAGYSSLLVGCKMEDEKKRQYRFKMRKI